MTVGAVSQFHLDRIIAVCERADMGADIIGIGVISCTINLKDGTLVVNSITYRPVFRERLRQEIARWIGITRRHAAPRNVAQRPASQRIAPAAARSA